MKLKELIIIIILVICSGCNAEYRIEFNDEKIKENLDVTVPKKMSIEDYKNSYENTISVMGKNKFYNFDITEKNNNVTLNYNYEFTTESFNSSYIADNCFETFKFLTNDENYYFIGQGSFKCLYFRYDELDSLNITIQTNHKLVETNADEIKDDEYIWHINQNNYNNKTISLVVSKEIVKQKFIIKYKEIITILLVVSAAFALAFIIIFINHKRVNRI